MWSWKKIDKNSLIDWFGSLLLPRQQIILLTITISLLVMITYWQVYRSVPLVEQLNQVIPADPRKIKEWGGMPTVVHAGLHIINFPEFSILTQAFLCDAILWFDFDPALVSLDTIKKFSFERGSITNISAPSTKIINGRLLVEYTLRIQFTSNLNYSAFPFDDHRIYLILTNIYLSPKEILFEANKAGFAFVGNMKEWSVLGTSVGNGYTESFLDAQDATKVVRHPAVFFAIDFRRTGMRQFLFIFLPLFAIFFTTLFILGFDPTAMSTFSLGSSSGAIASMITYRFVTQNMSPQIGYFSFGDYIFTLFMMLEVIQFFLVIFVLTTETMKNIMKFFMGLYILFVHCTIVTAWFLLLKQ